MFVVAQNDLPAASPPQIQGQTIAYVDDTSEQATSRSPHGLMSVMQQRADNIVSWLRDNKMVIAPTKTKLIVTATDKLRAERLTNINLSITLGGQRIQATPSERLLGVTISEDLTWTPHLWGEAWRESGNIPGVIPELLKRLGLIKHLGRLSSKNKMKTFVPGLFLSKLTYALPVFATIWGLSEYTETEHKKISCTKEHMLKLQTLHRQAALLLCPPELQVPLAPTHEVLNSVSWLSVHQQAAFMILRLALRIMKTGKPEYLATRLQNYTSTRRARQRLVVPRCRLNLAMEGFINQATRLVNKLPHDLMSVLEKTHQSTILCDWVRRNISIKPEHQP